MWSQNTENNAYKSVYTCMPTKRIKAVGYYEIHQIVHDFISWQYSLSKHFCYVYVQCWLFPYLYEFCNPVRIHGMRINIYDIQPNGKATWYDTQYSLYSLPFLTTWDENLTFTIWTGLVSLQRIFIHWSSGCSSIVSAENMCVNNRRNGKHQKCLCLNLTCNFMTFVKPICSKIPCHL